MNAMMPMMMPKKQAKSERIMRARVASKWAVDKVTCQQESAGGGRSKEGQAVTTNHNEPVNNYYHFFFFLTFIQ